MRVLERLIQQIIPDKWDALEAYDQKYDAVEKSLGFPAKRRYRAISGGSNFDTLVIEREWESMAAMKADWEKSFTNPAIQQLNVEGAQIISSNTWELYLVM